ncbi:MAG: DUF11 domain-containing protein [Anaerolineae bacterium]|nr:DUF11 domain-containing protein [Anaerolineae bacterium]
MSKVSFSIFIISVTLLTLFFNRESFPLSNFQGEISPPLWPSSKLAYAQTGPTIPPPYADLVVVKTDEPDPVAVSALLTYTITITNQATVDAENVTLADMPPSSVIISSVTPSQGSCNAPQLNFSCALGTIAGGMTATVTVVVTPTVAGEITNYVIVVSTTPEFDITNNRTEETTQVELASSPSAQKFYLPILFNWRSPPASVK